MKPKAYTIKTLLETYPFLSRSGLYQAWKEKRGPKRGKAGARVFVTPEMAEEWIESLREDEEDAT